MCHAIDSRNFELGFERSRTETPACGELESFAERCQRFDGLGSFLHAIGLHHVHPPLSVDQLDRLSKAMDLSDDVGPYQLHQAGLSSADLAVQQTMTLARQLSGMPRHLSIHVGGFVITHGPLVSMAPVEAGSMQDRTVVQWEKDDLSALDILKVDLLGLGMLTVIARSFELIEQVTGRRYDMATVPAEDPFVYDMICDADTIGTFQIESRAQQNMLPRLKPRNFYDLVIEIAIIRPGPIVGEMVHPFLRRRNGDDCAPHERSLGANHAATAGRRSGRTESALDAVGVDTRSSRTYGAGAGSTTLGGLTWRKKIGRAHV